MLVVDDDAGMRTALEISFLRHGWRGRNSDGRGWRPGQVPPAQHPLVVTDIRMPDGDGFGVMREARALAPRTAVILLTAYGSVPDAVTAMRNGACDYLVKPVSFEQLEQPPSRSDRPAPRADQPGTWWGILRCCGRSTAPGQAAATDADILIEAESGTGKELLARLIHRLSPRRDAVCGGQLRRLSRDPAGKRAVRTCPRRFHRRARAKPGKFELANGGTLLLDEVGEMPLGCSPSCCARCRSGSSTAWATRAASRRHPRDRDHQSRAGADGAEGGFAPICITASM